MEAAEIQLAEFADIMPLRALYLQETNCQIRYNARHERGWTDTYLLKVLNDIVGYGCITGQEVSGRDTIFEYFIVPPFKNWSKELFRLLIDASAAAFIECQSNDLNLTAMLYEFSHAIASDVILFKDHAVTGHVFPGASVRLRRDHDQVFDHKVEGVGDYVMAVAGEVVATGGFMTHYNRPFADLYMEVKEGFRRKGAGCFLVQEVKKACYLAGRVPAARCNASNTASRATLIKAGLAVCGHMLLGKM